VDKKSVTACVLLIDDDDGEFQTYKREFETRAYVRTVFR
jgi:ActR/RegA family two-component response regulator